MTIPMAPGGSDPPPVQLVLRDGRSVTIRKVRPDDRDAMQAAVNHFSPQARYMRFHAPLKALSPEMLERAVGPGGPRECAFVAVSGTGGVEAIVAGARYVAGSDDGTCEFAVAVTDDWQGVGLASTLLQHLILDAAAKGWQCMEGLVLATNTPMLSMARKLGFRIGESAEGPRIKRVWRPLV